MDENLKSAIKQVLHEEKTQQGLDPRPTDIDLFFRLLPSAIGGFAGKLPDTRSACAMAFVLVREAVGQCCMMGITRPITLCTDGSHLATMPSGPQVPGVQPTIQHNPATQATMVNQYPNQYPGQPGQGQPMQSGGLVTQYPTNAGQGGGVTYQGGPLGTSMEGGIKAVVTQMFPNDPAVHGPPAQPQAPR